MEAKHATHEAVARQRGLTLVGLAIVIAVTAIAAVTALPSFASLVDARRLDAAATPTGASADTPEPTRRGIDANIAHPAEYVDVAIDLPAQNFLVVRASQPCPAAPDSSFLNAGLRTLQHQP